MTQSWEEIYEQAEKLSENLESSLKFMDAFCDCYNIRPIFYKNKLSFSSKFSEFYNQLREYIDINDISDSYNFLNFEYNDPGSSLYSAIRQWINKFIEFTFDWITKQASSKLYRSDLIGLTEAFHNFRKDLDKWIFIKEEKSIYSKEERHEKPIRYLVYNLVIILPTEIASEVLSFMNQEKKEQTA